MPAGPMSLPEDVPVSEPRRPSPRRPLLIAIVLVGVSLVAGAGVLQASGKLPSGGRATTTAAAAAQTSSPVGSAEANSKDFGRIPRGDVLLNRFDASVFLVRGIDPVQQEVIRRRVAALPVVEAFAYESPAQALEKFRAQYLPYRPDLSGATEQMLPGSFRVELQDPSQFAVLLRELCPVSPDGRPDCVEGVDEVTDQHWLAWITFAGPWVHTADAIVGLASGVDPDRRRAIRGDLEALPVVERVDFESKAAARRRLEQQTGVSNPAALDELTLDSFRVRLKVPARLAELHGWLCSGRWTFTTTPHLQARGPGRHRQRSLCLLRLPTLIVAWRERRAGADQPGLSKRFSKTIEARR
jgi:cell division protein FtsX